MGNPVVIGAEEDKYIKSDGEDQFERYDDIDYS